VKNRPIVKKLKLLTSTMTKTQLQSLLAQVKAKGYEQITVWFNAQGDPLTADDFKQLNRWGVIAVRWLIGDWKRDRKEAYVAGKIKDLLIEARLDAIDYMTDRGETEQEAKDIFKEGFRAFSEEVLNG